MVQGGKRRTFGQMRNGDGVPYHPSVENVVDVHERIVQNDPDAEPGIENRGDVEYVLDHVRYGHYGAGPETLHETAFQLLRLLTANHPFVDGNKRTALATTVIFYFGNGYELDYAEELEALLVLLAIREDVIDGGVATEHLGDVTEPIESGGNVSLSELLQDVVERSAMDGGPNG